MKLSLVVLALLLWAIPVMADVTPEPIRLEVHYAAQGDSADWQTIPIPGTEIELTGRISGSLSTGFTSQGLPSLYVTVVADSDEMDIVFSEVVHGTYYVQPKGHNLFGGSEAKTSREFEIHRKGGKIVFFLPAGEPAEVPEFQIPSVEEIFALPEEKPAEPQPAACSITEGPWFIIEWMGGSDWIHPDYDFRWRAYRPYAGALLLLHWELWGIERLDTQNNHVPADGTSQPVAILGQFPEGDIPVLRSLTDKQELVANPSGGLEFYMTNEEGVSYFPSRCTPGLEIKWTPNPTLQRAWVYRESGGWRFCPETE